ncbi:hypothetical protein KC717_05870 [Candidatus Dojkabacteria bacterium]|uniref:Uncharacterized protein n=1 Tax=Candidatus Dojkabacteria bacterium TaxID=2099670 RepID=A0A955L9S5_9BACT|nr:hypothetical protein [Candidatus Dojkabacteria bacterium]
MKLGRYLVKNIRAIIFSGLLTSGLAILIFIRTFTFVSHFWIGASILYLVFVIEVLVVQFWAQRKLMQLNIPVVDRYSLITQIIMHGALPSLSYWGIIGFIAFDPNPGIWIWFLIGIFLLFTTLFTNMRAYYEDKFKLEQRTHYIYDLLKLVIFGLLSFDVIGFGLRLELNPLIISFFIMLIATFLLLLTLRRYHNLFDHSIFYVIVNTVMLGGATFVLLLFEVFSLFEVSLVVFLLYYISAGVLHHKLMRDLTVELVFEYLMVAALAIGMFWAV